MPDWLAYTLVAAVIIAFILIKFYSNITFRFNHIKAEGTIKNWMSMQEGGVKYFYPMIEFTTESGHIQTFRASERCEGEPLYAPGTKVIVKYSKKDSKLNKVIYPSTGVL